MKVMVDPGHYSDHVNQSPVDPSYYESATVWKLGVYLYQELKRRGVDAELTRHNIDENPGLFERGSKTEGYDLFISVHTNSTGDNKPSDLADFPVCYTQVSGMTDDIADLFLKRLEKELDSKSSGFKQAVRDDAGEDWYGVLRGAASVGTPGIIVEHGFHTCPANLRKLQKDDFLRTLASADADVIQQWWAYKTKSDVVQPSASSLYGVVCNVPAGDPGLNVRIGPGTNYPKLEAYSLLGNGNKVDIFGRNNNQTCVYIRIAGQYFGWVNAHYISLI
jgi:N-acetylmuramoyl-L-alanine amidase